MEYELIAGYSVEELNAQVNERLSNGWRLYKKSYFIRYNQKYCQVVIKKGSKDYFIPPA
jgi:hypothetical protein